MNVVFWIVITNESYSLNLKLFQQKIICVVNLFLMITASVCRISLVIVT